MKSTTKRAVTISVASVVIIALVLVAPFPFRINFSQAGYRLHRDMSEGQVTMTVKAWYWRTLTGYVGPIGGYFGQSNSPSGTMEITDASGDSMVYEFSLAEYSESLGLFMVWLPRYDPQMNAYTNRTGLVNPGLDTFIAMPSENYDYFDMASKDTGKSCEDILAYFRQRIDIDFSS